VVAAVLSDGGTSGHRPTHTTQFRETVSVTEEVRSTSTWVRYLTAHATRALRSLNPRSGRAWLIHHAGPLIRARGKMIAIWKPNHGFGLSGIPEPVY